MESVDYVETFIAVAEDCPVEKGTVPPARKGGPSVAERTYALLAEEPYRLTSADVLFTVFADRRDLPAESRDNARAEFFAKPQACLRASDLGKRYGWGIHADTRGRLALFSRETTEYAELAAGRTADGGQVKVVKAMRSSRAPRA